MFVTKCQRDIIWELDGQPAVEVLQTLDRQLDPADQELALHALFLGVVMNEEQHEYKQGDFLIRNVVGMDAEWGSWRLARSCVRAPWCNSICVMPCDHLGPGP